MIGIALLALTMAAAVPPLIGDQPPPPPSLCTSVMAMGNYHGCTDCQYGWQCTLSDVAWDPKTGVVTLPGLTIALAPGTFVTQLMRSPMTQVLYVGDQISVVITGEVNCQVGVIVNRTPQTPERALASLKAATNAHPATLKRAGIFDGDAVVDRMYFDTAERTHKVERLTMHGPLFVQKVCSAAKPIDFRTRAWAGMALQYAALPEHP